MALHQATRQHSTPDSGEPLIDVPKAAHLLGISPKTLRDWIQARKIEYVKVGARVLFQPATIRQFVISHTHPATP